MAKNDNGNNNEKVNVSILNDTILEHQKQARTDHMQYLDDMEIINSDIQDRVIAMTYVHCLILKLCFHRLPAFS